MSSSEQAELISRIEAILERLRPYLRQDDGDIEIVRLEYETNVLEVRFLGACKKCPLNLMTLRGGIERVILHEVPEIRRIEAVN